MQLVNFDYEKGEFRSRSYGGTSSYEQLQGYIAKDPRHPEYGKLVEAYNLLWKESGCSEVCGKCFSGTLPKVGGVTHYRVGMGCCDVCSHLSTTGCVAKPLDCAAFSCFNHTVLVWDSFPKHIQKAFKSIRVDVFYKFPHGMRVEGFQREASAVLSKESIAAMRLMRRRIGKVVSMILSFKKAR